MKPKQTLKRNEVVLKKSAVIAPLVTLGLVLDGSGAAGDRAESMLSWDVANGLARRAWARNPGAEFAIQRAMDEDDGLRVTLPAHAEDDVIANALKAAGLTS